MITVKELTNIIAQVETMVYSYIQMENGYGVPVMIDRQEALRKLNIIQDDVQVEATIRYENRDDKLTEVYLEGGKK